MYKNPFQTCTGPTFIHILFSSPAPFIRPVCTYCDRAKLVFAPTFSRFQYRNTDLFFISTHTQNLSINKNLNNNYLFKNSPFFQFSSVLMCHIIIYTSCTFVLFFFCLSEQILDYFVFHFVFSFDSPIVLCFLFIILCVFIHLLPHLCFRTVSFSTTFFSWCPLWKQLTWRVFKQLAWKHFWAADLKTLFGSGPLNTFRQRTLKLLFVLLFVDFFIRFFVCVIQFADLLTSISTTSSGFPSASKQYG